MSDSGRQIGDCKHGRIRRNCPDCVENYQVPAPKSGKYIKTTSTEALRARNAIAAECDAIKTMLLQKNAAYGNSCFESVRVFSKADPVEQIRVRIDDKLSRLMRGSASGEDVVLDLIGYLILLRIAEKQA